MWSIWQKNENQLSFYDPQFTATLDSFELIFEDRNCRQKTVEVDEVILCQGRVHFDFQLDCQLPKGNYRIIIHNTSIEEEYTTIPAIVY